MRLQLGTYNTIKATIAHVRKARGSYIHVSATLHYRGMNIETSFIVLLKTSFAGTPYQVHVSAAKAAVDAS
jgi:2,4-dienoyl-CoA reductase [(3E)-enoyl-CoA-producing], peroxisomal